MNDEMSNVETHNAYKVTKVGVNDDLARIVRDINTASWDDANEMTTYDVPSLAAYLKHADTLFVTCYDGESDNATLLGFCSARFEIKPYAKEKWLYVDELDVCANQRRKGAGKAMMQMLLALARDSGCTELWLGTEVDNIAANALYRSLDPEDVEQFIGYTYEFAK